MVDYGKTYIRCLFCLTGKEESVVKKINRDGLGCAFHPRKMKPFYKNGKWEDVAVSLLPGYVFVISAMAVPLNLLWHIPAAIRPLTYVMSLHIAYVLAYFVRYTKSIITRIFEERCAVEP